MWNSLCPETHTQTNVRFDHVLWIDGPERLKGIIDAGKISCLDMVKV